MTRNIFIGSAVLLTVILASCTKVIDVNLNDAAKKYVVEGNVTNQPGPYTVQLTQTKNFSDDNNFPGVSGATISITDVTAGTTEVLKETAPGVYQTQQLQGREGRTYKLDVVIGNNHFTASSTMPNQVPLDSLYTVVQDFFGKNVIAVVPAYTDPITKGNCYHFRQFINGVVDKTFYYDNDDFSNGKTNSFSLLRDDPDSTLHTGDFVQVEMQCTDRPIYEYWYSADMSSTGDGNGIPGNPVTNLTGGALGYFSAHTSQTKSLVVK